MTVLIDAFRAAIPGLRALEAPAGEAHIRHPPDRNLGKWAAYDISRARSDLRWQPRPLAGQVAEYVDWLRRAG
jgi:nucleoside-diphosphate-sugar epimerase